MTSVDLNAAPPGLDRLSRRSLYVGLAGLGATAIGGALDPTQFFRSWLLAWLFWNGIALGCLGILMLQHLSGGAWGLVIRRPLEAGARMLPLMALLFVPLLFGLGTLYVWARPEAVAADELLRHKSAYLNVPFFILRAAVYFAAWSLLSTLLTRWSVAQDGSGDPRLARRMTTLSGPGIIVYVLLMTFASVDWVMSLEPRWFSTIYGGLIVAGQALGALSFAIACLFLLSGRPPLSGTITARHFHDLGKLMLAFVMVWAYFAFSQFLIIWAGNLPEEIPWYVARLKGGWEWVGLALIVLQFGAPFLLLLSRDFKRDSGRLAKVALLIVAMRLVDIHWLTAPSFHPGSFFVHWMDLTAPIGVGGFWIAAFARELAKRPLLPMRDPYLAEALEHGRR